MRINNYLLYDLLCLYLIIVEGVVQLLSFCKFVNIRINIVKCILYYSKLRRNYKLKFNFFKPPLFIQAETLNKIV